MLSLDEARHAAGVLLRTTVDEIEQVPSFAGNQVFRLHCDGRVLFLKHAAAADVRREVAVLDALSERGVPVPALEACDLVGDLVGVPCLLVHRVGGRPLHGAGAAFASAGTYLRAVHDVVLDDFGALEVRDGLLRGEDPTWAATLARRTGGVGPVVDAGLVPADLVDQAAALLADRGPLLASLEGGHLLHGDFHPRHVYVADGHVTGIIDWGDATSGDPVYDLGRIFRSGLHEAGLQQGFALVDNILESYGDVPWLDSALTDKLLGYAVVFSMWSMEGEFAGGAPWPPWWPDQVRTLRLILDELGRR